MKKCKMLLSFAIALCSVGVLSSGGMEVKKVEAEEKSFEVVFKKNTSDSSAAGIDKDVVEKGQEMIKSFTDNDKAYAGKSGIKLGSSKAAGSITVQFNETYTIKSVRVVTAKYGSDTGYIKVGESSNLINDSNKKFGGTYDFEFTDALSTDSLTFASSSKRGYLSSFTVTYDDSINYTVSFDTDGGTVISNKAVSEGEKISRPEDPEKEGYKFGGWYSDSSYTTLFDFDSVINENTTIYAKWVEKNIGELFSENTNVEGALSFGFEYVGKSRSDVISIENLEMDKQNNAYANIRESTIKGTTTKLSSGFYINDSMIQTNTNRGCFIKNTTAFSDEIKAVMINWNQSPTKLNIYGAIDSEASKENNDCLVETSAEKNARVDITTKGIKYLYIDLNTNITKTSIISSIDIIYDEPSITNFSDMSLNFKTDYDFAGKTQGTDFTEAGMMIVKGSDVSATYSKKTANALPEGAIKATQTNYGKEFIVRLEDIPAADWETKVTVVPYILIEGTYYFGTAGVTSVIETAAAYASSDATITLSDGSVVNVRDVAAAIKN